MYVVRQSIQSSDCSADMNNTSLWLVHLSHCETNQVGSLGIDPMAVDWPGSIGDAGSLRVIHICLIVVWSGERGYFNSEIYTARYSNSDLSIQK